MLKKNILFVDDEPKVLQGMQRMLRPLRDEWEIATAESGPEALTKLAETPFDVIVTDMRMPGMDGAQLLTEVMRLYPRVVRIVLSGQSDQDTILRSIGPTHQYLSKPCDTETLKNTIQRACALRDLLGSEELRQLVSRLQSLPSVPTLYTEVLQELRSSEPSLEKIGFIIARDMGMTSKIMHLVNSAFFGFYTNVTHPARAVTILGLDKIRSLVLSIHIFSHFSAEISVRFHLDSLWQHCLRVANLSKEIAFKQSADKRLADEAFMAGLLHDAGKLILVSNYAEEYASVWSEMTKSARPLDECERAAFGASHAEIGAYLFGLWNLTHPILEAIAYHHRPGQSPQNVFSALTAVHAADCLDHRFFPDSEQPAPERDEAYLAQINGLDLWPAWEQLAQEAAGKEVTP